MKAHILQIIHVLFLSLISRAELVCQVPDEREVLRQLESPESRERFLSRISPQDKDLERLLLKISESPSGQNENRIDHYNLHVGLADAFGRLGTKEAIPWLIANITLWRYGLPANIRRWQHPSQDLEGAFPAVRALARIGPEALDALIQSYYSKPLNIETRLAIVFASSRIHNPRAKQLLKSVQYDINQLQKFVNEGLALPASGEDVKK